MLKEFDVVVVGGGVAGGLPAAAYLQRAGAAVALVEQADRCGTFFHSYERAPGVRFDVAPVNFSCMSPALVDLGLGELGYEIDFPDIAFSTVDGAGRITTFYGDIARTHAALACFSPRDAGRFVELVTGLHARARDILSAAFFTPEPDLERALDLTSEAVGIDRTEMQRLDAAAVVERLFEADAVRVACTAVPAVNLFGELLEPGAGALSWLWGFLLRACRAVRTSSALPEALERSFLASGGSLILNARARRFVVDDGVCRAVEIEMDGKRELLVARHAVISNVGASMTSELLGEDVRPGWRTRGRTVFTADVVLDRPLQWPTSSLGRSPRVYLVWESWERCLEWLRAAREEREEVFLGHLELTQFNVLYGTARGGCPLRVRFGTGPFIDDQWDARRPYYETALRERLAALDPGVEIRSLDLVTPLDYWHMNPAAQHGNPVGGDFAEGQWLGQRLPYRTRIPGLYASNSVWPTSLSWMAPGYNAACAVASDLGIRDQPWWSAPPLPDLSGTTTGTADAASPRHATTVEVPTST